jgi:hypothetical protein
MIGTPRSTRACWTAGACSLEAGQLPGGFVKAGLQAGDLAEPAVELGFLDAVAEVGDDLDQRWPG